MSRRSCVPTKKVSFAFSEVWLSEFDLADRPCDWESDDEEAPTGIAHGFINPEDGLPVIGRLELSGGFSRLLAVASSDARACQLLRASGISFCVVPGGPSAKSLAQFAHEYEVSEEYSEPGPFVDRACLATQVLTALGGGAIGVQAPEIVALRAAARLALHRDIDKPEVLRLARQALIWPGPGLGDDGLPVRMATTQRCALPERAASVFEAAADTLCAHRVWVPASWLRRRQH